MHVAFDHLLEHVDGHQFWRNYLTEACTPQSSMGIHLAIFAEPFLSMVLSGEKTIESRFSRNRCAPYGEVGDGDVILMKAVAGPICGISLARRAWSYDLASEPIDRIRERFGAGIGGDDQFWAAHNDALYATVIELGTPTGLPPVACDKRDRRGWVALRSRQMSLSF